MNTLHENQKLILDYLLNLPEGATLEELSAHLQITKTAVKEHIQKITNLGYLTYCDSKGQVGRPKRSYLLTENGMEVFPRQYSWLSTILLELLAQKMGSTKINLLMVELADKVAAPMSMRFKNIALGPARFFEITKVLNELGYRANLKQSDLRKGVVIEASNCVYHSVAKVHPELCQFDIRLIEKMSDSKVKLESCIARGGSVCRFCISKKTKDHS